MSLIETDIRRFFLDRLTPSAEQLRTRSVSFFRQGPEDDPGGESWYIPYPPDTPDLITLETEEIVPGLARLWADHPELAGLVAPLMELAERIAAENAQDEVQGEEDVSPYIYVMF